LVFKFVNERKDVFRSKDFLEFVDSFGLFESNWIIWIIVFERFVLLVFEIYTVSVFHIAN